MLGWKKMAYDKDNGMYRGGQRIRKIPINIIQRLCIKLVGEEVGIIYLVLRYCQSHAREQ